MHFVNFIVCKSCFNKNAVTFNRQLSKLLHDVEVNAHEKHFTVKKGSHKIHQKESQNDCGQRSMAWLMLVKKHSIDAVIKKL